jgi:hypothetical protein
MVEVDMQHKVEQLEEVMVVHHKQQRLKDGVLNHHNPPLVVDTDKSQAMEVVDQFGVLATRVALKDRHHILVSGCCLFFFLNFSPFSTRFYPPLIKKMACYFRILTMGENKINLTIN